MQKKDLISVIIPVYQAEATIENCLRSVCSNTYKNLEIIVVFRECGDGTLKKIENFGDDRIKIIKQEQNTGPGGARNIGLAHASGDWICFAEADDFVSDNFYSVLLEYIKKYNGDIACGEIVSKGKEWTIHNKSEVLESFHNKFTLLTNGACFDKIFKKSFIDDAKVSFMESVRWEDNPFIFRAFYYANRIITVPGIKYYYQPSMKIFEQKQVLMKDVVPVAENILSFFQSQGLNQDDQLLIKKKILQSFAKAYIDDSEVYIQLKQLMGDPFFLKIQHYKGVFRNFKRALKAKKRALLVKLHLRKQKGKN